MSKRLPIKPLCGQNTGNLANIALSNTSSLSNSQTVRRSSRIFAQSANAVKENKKVSSKHSCMSLNPSINKDDISHKNSKKFKVKKKIEISPLDDTTPTSSMNTQNVSSNNLLKPLNDINTSTILKNLSENSYSSFTYDEMNSIGFKSSKTFDWIDENQKSKIGK